MENNISQTPTKKARYLLRALCLFVIFVIALAGMYRLGYHYHPNVAAWTGEGEPRDTMVYGDTTYHLAGKLGSKGIASGDYKTEELLGEVKPKSLFDTTPPLFVWSVDGKEGYLLLIDEEEEKYLYYAEGEVNPAETNTQ